MCYIVFLVWFCRYTGGDLLEQHVYYRHVSIVPHPLTHPQIRGTGLAGTCGFSVSPAWKEQLRLTTLITAQ